jgi:AAA domain
MKPNINHGFAAQAVYSKQRIPQFVGNPLVEALPPSLDDEALGNAMNFIPECSPEQRQWEPHERFQLIGQLSSFFRVLPRHIQAARALDGMVKNGYVGRAPFSTEHTATFQRLYEIQQRGGLPSQPASPMQSQLSSALIGMSGCGKTSVVQRALGLMPQTIYHEALDITQITYVRVEAPYNGISVKGLAHSIFRKLDQLIPGADHGERYGGGKFSNKDGFEMMNHCARVMHSHFGGLLVIDEIQNLENAGTSKAALLSALVTYCNELRLPILFMGTSKARDTLGLKFSQARRSTGGGFPEWGPLRASGLLEKPKEWEDFLTRLWLLQWIQHPVALTNELSMFLYDLTQGIPDLIIKGLACAQWRAIVDRSETFNAATLMDVYRKELRIMLPMIHAMRTGDHELLAQYEERMVDFDELQETAWESYWEVREGVVSIRTDAMGHAADTPTNLANNNTPSAARDTTVVNSAGASTAPAKPPRVPQSRKTKSAVRATDFPEQDYRRAFHEAAQGDGSVESKLSKFGLIGTGEDLLGPRG